MSIIAIKRMDRTQGLSNSHSQSAATVTISVDGEAVLQAFEANTFFSRLRGLHAHLPIADNEALIIRPCNSIHTFTMPGDIDAVFLSAEGTVLDIRTLTPKRWHSVSSAVAVLETNANVCKRCGIKRGTHLSRDSGVWK